MNFILKLFVIPFLLLLGACNPSMMEINLYTSDFDAVKNGEIVEVPVKVSFQMMGEDKKNLLEKAKNYLESQGSVYTIVSSKMKNFQVPWNQEVIHEEKFFFERLRLVRFWRS